MRLRLRVLTAVLIVAPLLLVVIAAASTADPGKTVYTNRCKMCHGTDGTGNPAMARMLKVEFRALDSDYVQKQTDSELKNTIIKGKGKMAAVRGLSEQQLTDVISYLRSLPEAGTN